jgi:hypothetical protein
LSHASPTWGSAANTYILVNKLQTFQNKVLRIITKLPRVTPIAVLHEQTGMSLIRRHFKKMPTATSTNHHVRWKTWWKEDEIK